MLALAEQVGFCASEQILIQSPNGSDSRMCASSPRIRNATSRVMESHYWRSICTAKTLAECGQRSMKERSPIIFGRRPSVWGLAGGASRHRLRFEPSIMRAVESCAFVQENGPERVDVKRDLLARISAAAPADRLIATSSSASDWPPVVSAECKCL